MLLFALGIIQNLPDPGLARECIDKVGAISASRDFK